MHKILTKREKIIFYITIGLILFSFGFNLVIAPVLKKSEILRQEINLARAKYAKYMRLIARKDYIRQKYNGLSAGINVLEAGRNILVNVLSELDSLAKNANIAIVDIRPQSAAGTGLKEAIVDLKTEGTMEGYLKFIYDVENSLSLLRIKRFQLIAKPNAQTLEGNFSISRFSP